VHVHDLHQHVNDEQRLQRADDQVAQEQGDELQAATVVRDQVHYAAGRLVLLAAEVVLEDLLVDEAGVGQAQLEPDQVVGEEERVVDGGVDDDKWARKLCTKVGHRSEAF